MTSNKQLLVQGGLLFGGVALGAVTGYFYSKAKFDKLYAERADREVESLKQVYKRQNKTGEFASPESTIEKIISDDPEKRADYAEQLKTLNYSDIQGATGIGGPEVAAVIEEEIHVSRTIEVPDTSALFREHPDQPYLITVQEFMSDEPFYHDKLSYEYYPNGDVLVDPTEEPIAQRDTIVGQIFMDHFGNQSEDPEIVYVRNKNLRADFEITRNDANYQTHVAGLGDGD